MCSPISPAIKLKHFPVAMILTDDKPENAIHFTEGVWSCVIAMLSAAAGGKTAVFDRKTVGCQGGSIGLGFCDQFTGPPGGIEFFLSTGRGEGFPDGEGYKKTPELAKSFVENLPTTIIPTEYMVFTPLNEVDAAKQTPTLVSVLCNPDQLSALVVLANYGRPTSDNVIVEHGAGCHTVFLLPYRESLQERQRAVIGLTDITVRPIVDKELLSFTAPWDMWLEMEENVSGSFLDKKDWRKVMARL